MKKTEKIEKEIKNDFATSGEFFILASMYMLGLFAIFTSTQNTEPKTDCGGS